MRKREFKHLKLSMERLLVGLDLLLPSQLYNISRVSNILGSEKNSYFLPCNHFLLLPLILENCVIRFYKTV